MAAGMKIGTRISLAIGAIAAAALFVTGAFFATTYYLGTQAVAIYDGPMMAISFARSAFANAQIANHQLHLAEAGAEAFDPDALEFALDDMSTDLEVVGERGQSEKTLAIIEGAVETAEGLLDEALTAIEEEAAFAEDMDARLRVLTSEIETIVEAEAESGYLVRESVSSRTRTIMLTVGGLILAVLLLASAFAGILTRRLVRRLKALNERTLSVAQGDLEIDVPFADDADEIGEMARSLSVFRDNALANIRLQQEDSQRRNEIREAEEARAREKEAADTALRQAAERDAKLEVARREEFEALVSQLQVVLEAAGRGDYSARMTRMRDDEPDEVRDMVDGLIANFEAGIGAISAAVSRLADKDLTAAVAGRYEGALADVQNNTNQAIETLHHVLSEVKHNVSMVVSECSNMRALASDMNAGSRQASEHRDAVKRATDAINMAVDEVVGLTGTSHDKAEAAKTVARESTDVVADVVRSVDETREIFGQISAATEVIGRIASQTNLLALNASVEAARAGDAGLGFNVVAGEVRALAGETASAARQIGELTSRSSSVVEAAIDKVKEAGTKVTSVRDMVEEMGGQISSIDARARGQATATADMRDALAAFFEIMRSNEGMARDIERLNSSLVDAAHEVSLLVDGFNTRSERHADHDVLPARILAG